MPLDLSDMLTGAGVNLLVTLFTVRFIYYPVTQNKNYVFSLLSFSTVIYFVLEFLMSAEIGVGVGFGLFAIFSVLRYRTEEMSTREMTYLFAVIALPVINSFFGVDGEQVTVLVANGVIVALLWVLEHEWGFHFAQSKGVTYERIDLIRPQNRALLIDDLRQRTGLDVKRVEVGKIDFLHDTAQLTVFYDEALPEPAINPAPGDSARLTALQSRESPG